MRVELCLEAKHACTDATILFDEIMSQRLRFKIIMHFKISIKQKTEMELLAQAFTNSLIS